MSQRQRQKIFQDIREPEDGLRRQMTVGLIALIGLGPIVAAYLIPLWSEPAFRLFPLALACSLFLYWRAWHESPRPPAVGSKWISLLGAPIVLFILAVAIFKGRLALGYYTSLLGISLFLWSVGGWRLLRRSFPALLLALFCSMPVLQHFKQNLRSSCEITLEIASVGMGVLGVPNAVELDSLKLPAAQIIHVEPNIIAGVLFSSLVLGAFYSFVRRRPPLFSLMVVVATWFSAPLAIGLILTLCGSVTYYSQIAAMRWNTPWIGLVMGVGVFILGTWLPDFWLQRRYAIPLLIRNQPQKNIEPLMAWIRLGLTIRLISAVLLALGLLQLFIIAKRFRSQHRTTMASISQSSTATCEEIKSQKSAQSCHKKSTLHEASSSVYHA